MKLTVDEIVRLAREYELDFGQSWTRMGKGQAFIDGTYDVLKEKVDNFDPYHSPVHRASLNKTVERTVSYEPRPHIKAEGTSQKAKDVAEVMENESRRFLEGFTSALNRPPWRDGDWLMEARGKVAFKFQIMPVYFEDPPERQKEETTEGFARRTADYRRKLKYNAPFIYEPIDTYGAIIHPPTMSIKPPWVIHLSDMDVFEVLQRWPHWSDPTGRVARKEKSPVKLKEYCNEFERALLADDEPVTRISKDAKGSIVPNEYREVYYDILYSPYGQLPIMAEANGRTREERMAVSQFDLLDQLIRASDRVMSFTLLYMARFGFPLPYSSMSAEQYYAAVREQGHLTIKAGDTVPGVVRQDPLPNYVDQLQQRLGAERDFATLPPVAVGLSGGTTSGLHESQVLSQVDLQVLTARKAISNAMARALSQCWYAVKYILPESTVGSVTSLRREDIPDAPDITVDMEPPDENKKARNLAMALSLEKWLPGTKILEAGGHEDTGALEFDKKLEVLKSLPEVGQEIAAQSIEIVRTRLAAEEITKSAAAIPPAAPEPLSPTVGMPGEPPQPGSPEEMAAMQEAAMRMQPEPEGVL